MNDWAIMTALLFFGLLSGVVYSMVHRIEDLKQRIDKLEKKELDT